MRRLNMRHQLRQAHARTNSATNGIRGINRPSGSSNVRTSPHTSRRSLMLFPQSQQKGDQSSQIQLQRVEVNVEKDIQYDDDAPMTVQFFGANKNTTALVPGA